MYACTWHGDHWVFIFWQKRKIAVCENLAGGMLFLFWMSVCTHIYYICGCLNWFKCFTYWFNTIQFRILCALCFYDQLWLCLNFFVHWADLFCLYFVYINIFISFSFFNFEQSFASLRACWSNWTNGCEKIFVVIDIFTSVGKMYAVVYNLCVYIYFIYIFHLRDAERKAAFRAGQCLQRVHLFFTDPYAWYICNILTAMNLLWPTFSTCLSLPLCCLPVCLQHVSVSQSPTISLSVLSLSVSPCLSWACLCLSLSPTVSLSVFSLCLSPSCLSVSLSLRYCVPVCLQPVSLSLPPSPCLSLACLFLSHSQLSVCLSHPYCVPVCLRPVCGCAPKFSGYS